MVNVLVISGVAFWRQLREFVGNATALCKFVLET